MKLKLKSTAFYFFDPSEDTNIEFYNNKEYLHICTGLYGRLLNQKVTHFSYVNSFDVRGVQELDKGDFFSNFDHYLNHIDQNVSLLITHDKDRKDKLDLYFQFVTKQGELFTFSHCKDGEEDRIRIRCDIYLIPEQLKTLFYNPVTYPKP